MLVAFFQLIGGIGTVAPLNMPETTAFLITILGGTVIFAMLQGIIVQVLTTGDPEETAFRQRMDALNFMMRDNGIDRETRGAPRDSLSRCPSPFPRSSPSCCQS